MWLQQKEGFFLLCASNILVMGQVSPLTLFYICNLLAVKACVRIKSYEFNFMEAAWINVILFCLHIVLWYYWYLLLLGFFKFTSIMLAIKMQMSILIKEILDRNKNCIIFVNVWQYFLFIFHLLHLVGIAIPCVEIRVEQVMLQLNV